MKDHIEVNTKGIKNILKSKFNFFSSIAEYIWNGFDAKATRIDVTCKFSGDRIGVLEVTDNGHGINHKELKNKFKPFLESKKNSNGSFVDSDSHGVNGYGRLTFFKIAHNAVWKTTYKEEGKFFSYTIQINDDDLENFDPGKPENTKDQIGTTVKFHNLFYKKKSDENLITLENYLCEEFSWYLVLHRKREVSLFINNKEIKPCIEYEKEQDIKVKGLTDPVKILFVKWKNQINDSSRTYYLTSSKDYLANELSPFNRPGDNYYHSIFVYDDYFKDFNFNQDIKDSALYGKNRSDKIFKDFFKELKQFIFQERTPHTEKLSEIFISNLISEGVITKMEKDPYENLRNEDLKIILKEMYQFDSRIFKELKINQKKTLVGFIRLLLDSNNREKILEILEKVLTLTEQEKEIFRETLMYTSMSSVVRTLNFLKIREEVINTIQQLVRNKNFKANERDHLQKTVGPNCWIFGEKFNSVSEDINLQKSLEKYIYILRGEKENIKVRDEDKLKRLDIFMSRTDIDANSESINNLIIELKSPSVIIGQKELDQVREYMKAILNNTSDFNNSTPTKWTFVLIGNQFNKDGSVEIAKESMKEHNKKDLVNTIKNCEVYVKTWSQIFDEYKIRQDFINEKLNWKQEKLNKEIKSATEAVDFIKKQSKALEKGNKVLKLK